MIRRTLGTTQAPTFAVQLPHPDPAKNGMPTPVGTGFLVSADGYFVTAAHVVTENGRPDGPPRTDAAAWWLDKEPRLSVGGPGASLRKPTLVHVEPATDFALLKLDFAEHTKHSWLQGRTEFPFLTISSRDLVEAEPVYAFGYPLSEVHPVPGASPAAMSMVMALAPRTTSAIVASTLERVKFATTSKDVRTYVLDRALNYGNSGGPIVAVETGRVHALCSRFQPVPVPQHHIKDPQGKPLVIAIPSLYGVVSSLASPSVIATLQKFGVPIVND